MTRRLFEALAMNEAYVLHSLPWRETSLIVEVLTRDEGRMGLVARGARRPRSALRGLLQPFVPLLVKYSAKGELRTLMSAEWRGGLGALPASTLMAGFYLNELLIRLLPRQDAHPLLFQAYEQALHALSHAHEQTQLIEPVLRQFECRLLREMGLAPEFAPAAVVDQPGAFYELRPADGVYRCQSSGLAESEAMVVTGHTLMALASYDRGLSDFAAGFDRTQTAGEAKRLLRGLIRHQLGDVDLMSRDSVRTLSQMRAESGV
jgi:DNA repair protein RecO (recombination protein O)